MKKISLLFILALFTIAVTGCETEKLSSEEMAETMVILTAKAEEAQKPPPTATLVPTDTPLPTNTSTPTNTPEPTATPGPIVIFDDFSEKSDIWGKCQKCEWEDGVLLFGPIPPNDTADAYYIICEACGTPLSYRMGVDVTFAAGYGGDRGYGFLVRLTDDLLWDMEISTFQWGCLWERDIFYGGWSVLGKCKMSGNIKAGWATNRIEVEVITKDGFSRVTGYVNGKSTFVSGLEPAAPGKVGLLLGWHSVGIEFDNFEFEEIWDVEE